MIMKKVSFFEVSLCRELCVNFHSVAVKDRSTSRTLSDFWPNLNFLLQHHKKLVLQPRYQPREVDLAYLQTGISGVFLGILTFENWLYFGGYWSQLLYFWGCKIKDVF